MIPKIKSDKSELKLELNLGVTSDGEQIFYGNVSKKDANYWSKTLIWMESSSIENLVGQLVNCFKQNIGEIE